MKVRLAEAERVARVQTIESSNSVLNLANGGESDSDSEGILEVDIRVDLSLKSIASPNS